MATTRQETDIELERLTAVRERHLVGRGDDHDRIHLGSHACPDLSGAPPPGPDLNHANCMTTLHPTQAQARTMRTTRSAQFRGFAQAEERDASTDGSPLRGTPVVLRDGAGVWIRPWRPSDTRLMVRGFYRLSPTSSYRRFLSASPVLTNQMLHDLTDVDHHDAEAVLAVDERRSEGLGIARYIRTARPDVAEVALTVMDEWQGRGLGALLLEAISARAREEGIRTFTAVMLSENHAMRHLLERLGPLRVIHHDRGTVEAEVPLPGAGASDEPREAAAVTV